jgi:hypothetical protein
MKKIISLLACLLFLSVISFAGPHHPMHHNNHYRHYHGNRNYRHYHHKIYQRHYNHRHYHHYHGRPVHRGPHAGSHNAV